VRWRQAFSSTPSITAPRSRAGDFTLASVTNASQAVIGRFTAWTSALQPGDLLFAGGHANVIKSIEDDERLTLAIPWTGPTLVEQPYVAQRWMQHTDGRWIGVKITEYFAALEAIPAELASFIVQGEAARDAAIAARDDAQTAQTGAEAARDTASTQATAAETARTAAQTARTGAETARAGAETAATAAGTSQAAAVGSATAAATSATNGGLARDAAIAAQGIAEGARDTAVSARDAALDAAADAAGAVAAAHPVIIAEATGNALALAVALG
jgi:hypothetical protein